MVVWTAPAKQQLRDIFEYIRKSSPYYAVKVVETLVSRSETLETFPERGRIVPEFNSSSVREIYIYSYRLIYEIQSDRINILAVIHGKMDMESAIESNKGTVC